MNKVLIEFDTKQGRVKIEMPATMTAEDRAELFCELAEWEIAVKTPMNFGDLRLKKTID